MYSVVLMMAMTTGGDSVALGHRHGGGCGETSCGCEGGRRHHHRGGGGGGESYGCATCGYSGCSTCGYAYAPTAGCPTCAGGYCPVNGVALAQEAPATIVVSLPADARLTIDDEATTSTSDHRVFVSPNLPTGKEFHYTLKAEIQVDGKARAVSQVVTVRAGEETRVSLSAATGVAER